MNTNFAGVTENAFANIDKEKFDANYLHVFRKDLRECEECKIKKLMAFMDKEADEMLAEAIAAD